MINAVCESKNRRETECRSKRELAREFSESLEKIAGKNRKFTYIVFEEVERENWAIGGQLLGSS